MDHGSRVLARAIGSKGLVPTSASILLDRLPTVRHLCEVTCRKTGPHDPLCGTGRLSQRNKAVDAARGNSSSSLSAGRGAGVRNAILPR